MAGLMDRWDIAGLEIIKPLFLLFFRLNREGFVSNIVSPGIQRHTPRTIALNS